MKIAVAQTKSVKGAITENIEIHKKLIDLAIDANVDAIFFPELSITGYEPELANRLATKPNDKRFGVFQEISDKNKITIGIGVPIKSERGVLISMLVFQPQATLQVYSKQQLHSDELPYFVKGDVQLLLNIANVKVAPAICYESLQPNHSYEASLLGTQVYVASVAKSQNGVNKAVVHFPDVARQYSMPVLMTNSVGFCDNFESFGMSSVWTSSGDLAGQLDTHRLGLLAYNIDTEVVDILYL
jgi:predicted amidohydrolase